MPVYRVCPDDGCVVGDDVAHQRFHAQMASLVQQLTALTPPPPETPPTEENPTP